MLIPVSAFSQEEKEHFKFKGIEINGTLDEFASRLENVGFSPTGDESVFKGQFAGDDCNIYIMTTKGGLVYSVCAVRSKKSTWASLKLDYKTLKEGYINKYGTPLVDVHRFSSPYYEGDGYEITAVRTKKVIYMSSWHLDNGSISEIILDDCSVALYYTDNINDAINESEKKKQFSDDL